MRTLKIGPLLLALTGFVAFASTCFANTGPEVATDNVKARLISETQSITPGQPFWVGLELTIRDGWHTYWRNPGDSGRATQINWTLPANFHPEPILWTTPERFEIAPLVNYGYAKHALHLVRITAPQDLKSQTLTLTAKSSWLVCSDVCIPENVELHITLPTSGNAGASAIDPTTAPLFKAARSALAIPAPAPTTARLTDHQFIIKLGSEWGETLSQIQALSFYPYDEGIIEYAAPQTLTRSGDLRSSDSIELRTKPGYQSPKTGKVRGLLLATERSNNGTLTVPLEIAADFTAAPDAAGGVSAAASAGAATRRFAPSTASNSSPSTASNIPIIASSAVPATSLFTLVLLAVLGGLVLNLMPCVFPVLSIKAIGLVEQAKKHPAAVRTKGLVFAAGVISSMLGLAAVLLTLRAGGEQIGWGFQLQSPLFVTLMVYLLLAVGLNLSGVFEIGGGLAGVGDGLTKGDSYRASFFTGVLTTLVATPCTAPFMAAAVGAALTQTHSVALLIFAALGLGLALPYVLLSFAPWMRRALPRPGAWMDTLKQIFAFPMYASAAWLLWVLAQQSSIGLAAALTGVILVALAAWAYQKSKTSTGGSRLASLLATIVALILAIALPLKYADSAGASGNASSATGTGVSGTNTRLSGQGAIGSHSTDEWQPYDAARVTALVATGKPLLINFTASWCLTCLVNERNAFADSAVQAVFHNKGVTLMKGDWTSRDPAITQALTAFGRAGVPLYVVYNAKPGDNTPSVLPQLLTASIVKETFADLPNVNVISDANAKDKVF